MTGQIKPAILARGLSRHFGRRVAVHDLDLELGQGEVLGFLGPNGAGKTTLFKMITGKEKPDEGTFEIGETVKIAYVDQEHDDLKPEDTVWQAITGGNEIISSRA